MIQYKQYQQQHSNKEWIINLKDNDIKNIKEIKKKFDKLSKQTKKYKTLDCYLLFT